MQRKILIILLILAESCASKHIISEEKLEKKTDSVEARLDKIIRRNISNEGFYITKASVSIKINGETKQLIVSEKFKNPGIFLFSVKSLSGIEGARIYLSPDTLMVNNRIEKKLLIGKPKDLEKILGMSIFSLNSLIGDLIITEKNEKLKLEEKDNEYVLTQIYLENICKSTLDFKNEKVKSINFLNNLSKDEIEIKFSKFRNDDKNIPTVIELNDIKKKIVVKIRLRRVQIPWDGELEFIPGKGYKIEEIK